MPDTRLALSKVASSRATPVWVVVALHLADVVFQRSLSAPTIGCDSEGGDPTVAIALATCQGELQAALSCPVEGEAVSRLEANLVQHNLVSIISSIVSAVGVALLCLKDLCSRGCRLRDGGRRGGIGAVPANASEREAVRTVSNLKGYRRRGNGVVV